jgi:hypothetical protein
MALAPVVAQLIAHTLGAPPGETTHWTSRAMAAAMGLAVSTVQKIWHAHGLAPHRLRVFKLSRRLQRGVFYSLIESTHAPIVRAVSTAEIAIVDPLSEAAQRRLA